MHQVSELTQLVEQNISQYPMGQEPLNLYKPIVYTMELGGKRLRPVMCLMAAEMFGVPYQKAMNCALASEFFHNFTLLHDDLMDRAPIRRGKPTVYKKWNDNAAILSGDALLIKAYQELNNCTPELLPQAHTIFSKFALEVCEGQQLDVDFENRNQVSLDEYILMIKLKTSVLFGGVMQLGALVAGADAHNQQLVYDFGLNFGLGFQLQDDYLDSFGDQDKFGKTIGGDILCNKKTALLIRTLEVASEEQQLHLQKLLTNKTDTQARKEDKIKNVKELYCQTGADNYTLNLIKDKFQEASRILELIDAEESKKEYFKKLISKLAQRNT